MTTQCVDAPQSLFVPGLNRRVACSGLERSPRSW